MNKRQESELVKKVLKEVLGRAQKNESFFESKEFNRTIELIKTQESLSEEDLMYGLKKIEGLTYPLFNQVCNSVFHVLDSQMISPEPSRYTVDYKDLRFNLLIGQGAVYWTEKL